MRNLVVGTFLGLLSFMAVWSGQAREIAMIAPIISPHFDDRGRGRIGDVISAVMKHCGHSVTFNMVPFGCHWADYKEQEVDALATSEAAQAFPGYTTKPFIHLQDGATVVEGSGLEITIGVENFCQEAHYQLSGRVGNPWYRTPNSSLRQF